jgi:solute carrier family 27 fatty acid transporter 1/4
MILLYIIVSGTYKLKKLDLQKEGFDVRLIKDQLYFCNNKGVYENLTLEAYNDILAGKIRL